MSPEKPSLPNRKSAVTTGPFTSEEVEQLRKIRKTVYDNPLYLDRVMDEYEQRMRFARYLLAQGDISDER